MFSLIKSHVFILIRRTYLCVSVKGIGGSGMCTPQNKCRGNWTLAGDLITMLGQSDAPWWLNTETTRGPLKHPFSGCRMDQTPR